jgi:hypothetical protein
VYVALPGRVSTAFGRFTAADRGAAGRASAVSPGIRFPALALSLDMSFAAPVLQATSTDAITNANVLLPIDLNMSFRRAERKV